MHWFWRATRRALWSARLALARFRQPRRPTLSTYELDEIVFIAAAELLERQRELLPLVTEALGADPYDYWITNRLAGLTKQRPLGGFPQNGLTVNGQWEWFFHGLECDIKNTNDGRFVRMDFGPAANRLTFTGWGIMQFVMTSKQPWREFPVLQSYLARKRPPYDEYSGSDKQVHLALDRLMALGLVGPADPKLCRLCEMYTVPNPSGGRIISIPEDLRPRDPADVLTCERLVITDRGRATLSNLLGLDSTHMVRGISEPRCPECGERI